MNLRQQLTFAPDRKSGSSLKHYSLDTRPSEALVIHCADPRFQDAFRRFVTEELKIATYTLVVAGGGAQALGAQESYPENFATMWDQVKFFIQVSNLRRVVVINHEDCLWYRRMHGHESAVDLPSRQRHDLCRVADMIRQEFEGIEVRSFWAALEGDRVSFRAVDEA